MKAFTGSAPFDLHLSITVALAIMRGDRPSRPIHPTFTHGLWELMEHCWNQEPSSRPDMPEVLRILHDPLASLSFHNNVIAKRTVSFCTARPLGPPSVGPVLILTKEHIPHRPAQTRTVADRVGAQGKEACPLCPHPQPHNDPAPAWAEPGSIVTEYTH